MLKERKTAKKSRRSSMRRSELQGDFLAGCVKACLWHFGRLAASAASANGSCSCRSERWNHAQNVGDCLELGSYLHVEGVVARVGARGGASGCAVVGKGVVKLENQVFT